MVSDDASPGIILVRHVQHRAPAGDVPTRGGQFRVRNRAIAVAVRIHRGPTIRREKIPVAIGIQRHIGPARFQHGLAVHKHLFERPARIAGNPDVGNSGIGRPRQSLHIQTGKDGGFVRVAGEGDGAAGATCFANQRNRLAISAAANLNSIADASLAKRFGDGSKRSGECSSGRIASVCRYKPIRCLASRDKRQKDRAQN